MKIDIYTCHFGSGHRRAAEKIQDKLIPEAQVEVIDLYREIFPRLAPHMYRLYQVLVKSPKKAFTSFSERLYSEDPEDYMGYLRLMKKEFFRQLDSRARPQVFLATYSVAAYLLGEYLDERGLDLPLVIYITDYQAHKLWLHKACRLYLVPSLWTKHQLIRQGVPAESIRIVGEEVLRTCPKRGQGKRRLLVSGGGLGLLPENMDFYRRLDRLDQVDIKVICGKNTRLLRKLRREDFKSIECYGLVEDMEEKLSWAQVFLGKPGGMSVKEAIGYELPILYLKPRLTQEKKNRDFIEESQIGCCLDGGGKDLAEEILMDRGLCQTYISNIRKIKAAYDKEALTCLVDGSLF